MTDIRCHIPTEIFMFRSIRWRLIISYIFLALLVVGVLGSITYQLAKNLCRKS